MGVYEKPFCWMTAIHIIDGCAAEPPPLRSHVLIMVAVPVPAQVAFRWGPEKTGHHPAATRFSLNPRASGRVPPLDPPIHNNCDGIGGQESTHAPTTQAVNP